MMSGMKKWCKQKTVMNMVLLLSLMKLVMKTEVSSSRNDSGCRLRHHAKDPTKALVIWRRTCISSNWVVIMYIYPIHAYIICIYIIIYIYWLYVHACLSVRQSYTPKKTLDMILLGHLLLSRISILWRLSKWKNGLYQTPTTPFRCGSKWMILLPT